MWIKKLFCLVFGHRKFKDHLGLIDKDGNDLCIRCRQKLDEKP